MKFLLETEWMEQIGNASGKEQIGLNSPVKKMLNTFIEIVNSNNIKDIEIISGNVYLDQEKETNIYNLEKGSLDNSLFFLLTLVNKNKNLKIKTVKSSIQRYDSWSGIYYFDLTFNNNSKVTIDFWTEGRLPFAIYKGEVKFIINFLKIN